MLNWMGFIFDKENIEILNKYVRKYMEYSKVSLEKALENYYNIAFNSVGFLTGTPFSFDSFKKFIDENNLLNFGKSQKNKNDKNKE